MRELPGCIRFTTRLFAAFAVLLSAAAAHAGGLGVSPILLTFDSAAPAQALWLSNAGEQILHGQVRAFRWTQENGEDVLTPTRDLVLSPPMLEIAAGQQQLVRVIRATPLPADEQAYRILINELPSATAADRAGLNFVMEFSVPVFVGNGGTPAALDWSLRDDHGALDLSAHNHGGSRAQISQLELFDADGKRVLKQDGLYGYVLAGRQRRWHLTLPPQAAPRTLLARINGEPIRAPIRADGAP